MKWFDFSFQGVSDASFAGWSGLRSLFSTTPPPWAYFLDFCAYPLLIVLCAALALRGAGGREACAALGLMAAGYGLWTFAEYQLHRHVMHHVEPFREGHMAHHDAPRDLIGTPTIVSVANFFVLVYGPLIATMGLRHASALSVGLLAGYLSYVAVHHALHNWSSHGSRILQRLKRHHALHHHHAEDCNFGVTTTVWDRLFGTLR